MIPVQVTIQYLHEGQKATKWVKLSLDQTVTQTVDKLVSDLALPRQDSRGAPISYQLVQQRQVLEGSRTLGEIGVEEGNILQLHVLDANATVGINLGQMLAGSLLDRLGGKGGGELLTISAVFADVSGRVAFQLKHTRALIGRADPEHGYPADMLDGDLTEVDTRRTVSRPHALIVYSDGEFTIRDLYSQHGVTINGTRLSPNMAHPLQNGDVVRFGEVELRFHHQ
ncbi:MAG: FHA domain-containing protein [Anaerolineae bacterium]